MLIRNSAIMRHALSLAALLSAASLPAESAKPLPAQPPSERIVYSETTDGVKTISTQELRLVRKGEESWYEVKLDSEKSKSLLRLDAASLFPFYAETTTKAADSEIRRVTELLKFTAPLKDDELGLLDMNSFAIQLRLYPWERRGATKIVFIGAGPGAGSGFSMEFAVVGRETLNLGGSSYECYKAQIGLTGIWSAVYPKSNLWFSVKAPHYLVKSEGLSGGPGSPKRIVELVSYEAGAR